ncbi:CDP-glycerol glycerophosphotransferase family protein [Vibrio lentus]|uniref:CDP-glycerol glycerophosphotransferase family protein n=1 Tax=Vibrio lentus TaxID=136468 RepID=UPI003D0FC9C8
MIYLLKIFVFYTSRCLYKVLSKFVKVDNSLIFFESFRGGSTADSPMAIYREINFKCKIVWVLNDHETSSFEDKEFSSVIFVSYKSLKYWLYLAKARILISNCILPFSFVKKDSQVYIQTWHGTTIKKLGLDIVIDNKKTQDLRVVHKVFSMEGKRADFFLSPSKYMDDKLHSIFSIGDEKLFKVGYPKNDRIVNGISKLEKEKIIKSIGLDESKPILLYAPTFRDGKDNCVVERLLNDSNFLSEIGDKFNLIYRGHYYQDHSNSSGFLDLSKYQDINDLFLISDILVTDYSSVFFDFALLDRTIYFYTPDKEKYDNSVRGLYFAPEDVLKTLHHLEIDSLILSIIKDEDSRKTNDTINMMFNYREDGRNASRVVSLIKECNREF